MRKKILPDPLDEWAITDPPEYDYVLPGLLAGTVGVMAGAGGVGKSWLAYQLSYAVAGASIADFSLDGGRDGGPDSVWKRLPQPKGRVVYLNLEDPSDARHARTRALSRYFSEFQAREKINLETVREVYRNIEMYGYHGQYDAPLMDKNAEINGEWMSVLRECAKGTRLLVIDTLRRIHDADENDNGQMAALLRVFEQLAQAEGCAVLIVHHESKNGSNPDAGALAVRGASAIVGNARWIARLQAIPKAEAEGRIDPDEWRWWAKLTLEKCNYGEPIESTYLRREEGIFGGVLTACELPPKRERNGGNRNVRRVFK